MNLKDLINRGVLSFRHFIKFNKVNKVEENEEYEILVRSKSKRDFNIVKWTDKVESGGDGIQSIQEGDNISIDNTDPQNPVISALGGGDGAELFIKLNDTPPTYTGQAGRGVRVKGDETGLEYYDIGGMQSILIQNSESLINRANLNPASIYQAIWSNFNKPVWHIGMGIYVDATGVVLDIASTIPPLPDGELAFTIKLTATSQTFRVPIRAEVVPDVDIEVDWGDGSAIESFTATSTVTHIFNGDIGDEFQIKITGTLKSFDFSMGGSYVTSAEMLRSVDYNTMPKNWEYIGFQGCNNVVYFGERAFSSFIGESLSGLISASSVNQELKPVTFHKDAFKDLTNITNIDNMFGTVSQKYINLPSGIFDDFVNVTSARYLLRGYQYSTLPDGLIDNMTSLENTEYFLYGSKLTSINDRFFQNQTNLTNVKEVFRANSLLVADAFQLYEDMNQGLPSTVSGCFHTAPLMTNLASVPSNWKTL